MGRCAREEGSRSVPAPSVLLPPRPPRPVHPGLRFRVLRSGDAPRPGRLARDAGPARPHLAWTPTHPHPAARTFSPNTSLTSTKLSHSKVSSSSQTRQRREWLLPAEADPAGRPHAHRPHAAEGTGQAVGDPRQAPRAPGCRQTPGTPRVSQRHAQEVTRSSELLAGRGQRHGLL